MILAGVRYGGVRPPCIVAELSCNHVGDKDRAHDLIEAAAHAGADAVKFQLYAPDEMTLRSNAPAFRLTSGPWAGRTLWDLYAEAATPREWFPNLFAHVRELGLVPFASVFSLDGIVYLETLDCPAYKIASAEVPWLDLVRGAADTRKPVILSDGAASDGEMADAIRACRHPVVLSCVAKYPADPGAHGFGRYVHDPATMWGLSDHSLSPTVAACAAAMGACMIEAHLQLGDVDTLDRKHSYTPGGFQELVETVRLGYALRRAKAAPERPDFARRLVWARDMPSGIRAAVDDVRALRCATGLSAGVAVRGTLARQVSAGEPVVMADFGTEDA